MLAADPAVNFVSLAVGDPILNQAYQWPQYPDTLYGMGVLMDAERAQLRTILAPRHPGLHQKVCRG